jgi:serine phosphatase RsbU (regulator of sigma subunit)
MRFAFIRRWRKKIIIATSHRPRGLKARSGGLLRRLWRSGRLSGPLLEPCHCDVPPLRDAEIAAVYHGRRIAGDFYECIRVSPCRVLFALLDVAGRRADTRNVLIAAQNTFRNTSSILFAGQHLNEAEAMSELCQNMNRTILQCSSAVRSCPAFLGCFNENLGTLCYANAGHTPGLLVDGGGTSKLEATGLPLGLFSHAVHGSSTCALVPGAILLIVSRGVIEVTHEGEEFGLEGVNGVLQGLRVKLPCGASEVCTTTLKSAQAFIRGSTVEDDLTTLCLVRSSLVRNSNPAV